jgi:hypothetical protein
VSNLLYRKRTRLIAYSFFFITVSPCSYTDDDDMLLNAKKERMATVYKDTLTQNIMLGKIMIMYGQIFTKL